MSRPETVKLWTERLQRFEQAHTTVAQFCKDEGVSQPSFYKWKQKLKSPQLHRTGSVARFVPVALPSPSLQANQNQLSTSLGHTTTTIELPGGIRICIETPAPTQHTNSSGAGA